MHAWMFERYFKVQINYNKLKAGFIVLLIKQRVTCQLFQLMWYQSVSHFHAPDLVALAITLLHVSVMNTAFYDAKT
jgi:hypothetical protein